MTSFISVIKEKNIYRTLAIRYFIVTAVIALIGIIYEIFSHGVFSAHMAFAFLYTLIGGCVLSLILGVLSFPLPRNSIPIYLYNCGLATLVVGSIFRGVLHIYGTGTTKIVIYSFLGWGLVGVAAGIVLIDYMMARSNKKNQ